MQLPVALLKFWIVELQVQLPKMLVSAAAFWIAPMTVRFGKKLERPEAANGVRPVSPAPFTTPLVSVMAKAKLLVVPPLLFA